MTRIDFGKLNRIYLLNKDLTREDKIRNKYVRGSIGVALIVDKMRKNRLK